MASGSGLLPETQFLCSICLDVFTDMVSTPCGHNFCKPCITHYWDTSDVCQCPLCKKTFNKRPELFVNTFITELAAQSRKSLLQKINHNVHREDVNVPCHGDALVPCKLKALMSCLVCQTSYCKTHLEPHQRFEGLKRHKLIDAVQNLEEFICQKHNQPLEHFCKTDNVSICQFCTESDHKSHRIVSLEEECKERKAELGKTDAEVQQMIQKKQEKIQEINHPVELSRKDADREKADGVQVFTALISRFERSQAGLIDGIEEKQQTIEKQAKGFIKELQQEITQLEKRSSKLKQLSQTEDQFHLIKNFSSTNNGWLPTKDWTDINVHPSSYFGRVRTAVAELEKTLGQEMEKKLCDTELKTILPHTVDVTLDPDTAHCKLIVSEDGKQVSHGPVNKHLQENPTIFSESVHVLGKQSFSSGKFYFDVQVAGNTKWRLGVARKSVNKKGETSNGNCWTSKLSPNNGYWTMGLMNGNKYKAGGGSSVLPITEEVQRVGVFVDYDEGLVSFYDVETRVHLYSFTGCTFTDKLFPFFSPCPGYGGDNAAPLIISPVNSTHSHPQLNQRRISTLSLASTHLPKKEKKKMFFSFNIPVIKTRGHSENSGGTGSNFYI